MNQILSNLESILLNLSNKYKTFSSDESLQHNDIKDFDKEVGDLLEKFQLLKGIQSALTDEEFRDSLNELNNALLDFNTKIQNGYFENSAILSSKEYTDLREGVINQNILEASSTALNSAKDYTDQRETAINEKISNDTSSSLTSAKDYTDQRETAINEKISNDTNSSLTSAKDYTDQRETAINEKISNDTSSSLNSAKDYTDQRETAINEKISNDTNSALTSAKDYTDQRETAINEKISNDTNSSLNSSKDYTDQRETAINEKISNDTVQTLNNAKEYISGLQDKDFRIGLKYNILNFRKISSSESFPVHIKTNIKGGSRIMFHLDVHYSSWNGSLVNEQIKGYLHSANVNLINDLMTTNPNYLNAYISSDGYLVIKLNSILDSTSYIRIVIDSIDVGHYGNILSDNITDVLIQEEDL